MAGAALLGGSLVNAETILLHNGMVYPAISLNMQMHNWNRALDIALKHKTHVDTVLSRRKQYLQTLGKNETNKKFLALKDSVSETSYCGGDDRLSRNLFLGAARRRSNQGKSTERNSKIR